MSESVIEFVRRRDYILQKELGQGACGKTVLLYDDLIKRHFVCKKYVPYAESERQVLFTNFVREIQLLHEIFHPNVVRVFNYYLYPEQFAGYILMEYVDGIDVEEYLKSNPETINEIFLQAIAGFRYLESCGILHRDIRPGNILVRNDGVLKIIDLGFGKRIETPQDFDKSITLNWWCERPAEFANNVYDFKSELYFVGKLFEKVVQENEIEHFKYQSILARMCVNDHLRRMGSFQDIEREMESDRFYEIEFSESELSDYRIFADALCSHIVKIKDEPKYINDLAEAQKRLENAYRTFMLEKYVPDPAEVTRCFLNCAYYYRKQGFEVYPIKAFIRLLKSTSEEKKKIIMANIQTRLNAIERYQEKKADLEDDIPF